MGCLFTSHGHYRGTETAALINEYIVEGKIVPAAITVRLLRNAMEASGKQKFLVDGFPRNLENLEVWNKVSDGKAPRGHI